MSFGALSRGAEMAERGICWERAGCSLKSNRTIRDIFMRWIWL